MKRSLALATVILLAISLASAQDKVAPIESHVSHSFSPGYITINDITGGIGLGITDVPYGESFYGFTTIHGYQINQNYVVAGGAGVSYYNGGRLIPVFLDFRYSFLISEGTPYLFCDGGMLFGEDDRKLFINGGGGIRFILSDQFGLNLGMGLWMQKGTARDTFINLKVGVVFKP